MIDWNEWDKLSSTHLKGDELGWDIEPRGAASLPSLFLNSITMISIILIV